MALRNYATGGLTTAGLSGTYWTPGTTDERLTRLETAMVMMAQAGETKALADGLALETMDDLNNRLRALERGAADIRNQLTGNAAVIVLAIDTASGVVRTQGDCTT